MLHGFGGGGKIPVFKAYSMKQIAEYLGQPYERLLQFCQEYIGSLNGLSIDTDLTRDCVCGHNYCEHEHFYDIQYDTSRRMCKFL